MNRIRDNPRVLQLVESATRGTLPADLIRDMIYNQKLPIEEGVSRVELYEGEAAFVMDTPEHMTQLEELVTALAAADVPFSLSDNKETNEIILSWEDGYTADVESAMSALGITVYDDTQDKPDYQPYQHKPGATDQVEPFTETAIFKPQGDIKRTKLPYQRKPTGYLARLPKKTQTMHGKGLQPEVVAQPIPPTMEQGMNVKEMIDSVVSGESAQDLVSSVCEAKKVGPKKALLDLYKWATGQNRTGNPYQYESVRNAIRALGDPQGYDLPDKRPKGKIKAALFDLATWATTGNKTGNPYMKPEVKAANKVLGGDRTSPPGEK